MDSQSLERDSNVDAMDILNEESPEILGLNPPPTDNKQTPPGIYVADDLSRDPMRFNDTDDEVLLTQGKDFFEHSQQAILTRVDAKQIATSAKNEDSAFPKLWHVHQGHARDHHGSENTSKQ